MRVPASIMINVLGGGAKPTATGAELEAVTMAPVSKALQSKQCSVHWYGKAGGVKAKRKMGHITICAQTEAEADAIAGPIMELAYPPE
jgi:phosphoribosylaminoimidazole carboxylase (NCAIR synthetase)